MFLQRAQKKSTLSAFFPPPSPLAYWLLILFHYLYLNLLAYDLWTGMVSDISGQKQSLEAVKEHFIVYLSACL